MEHLPPWLRNVPLPPRPTTGGTAADDTPDWLREPVGSIAPTPAARSAPPASPAVDDDTPDWLRDLENEIGATPTGDTNLPDAPTRSEGDDDTPDWLREPDAGPTPAPVRSAPDPFGATGWLQSLSAEVEADEPSEPEPPPTTTTSRIRMPVGATDWLRSIGQDLESEEPQEPRQLPSEMTDDKSGVPDWLRDVSPSEIIATMADSEPAVISPPPQPIFDPLASNWLTDDPGTPAEESTGRGDWIDNAPSQDETVADDGVPAWLREVVPDSFDMPEGQERPRDPGSLPDWLSTSASEDAPATLGDADVPDWLRDVTTDEGAAGSPGSSSAQMDRSPEPDDVPDWLRGAEAAPPTIPTSAATPSSDDVPDWLREAEAAPPTIPAGPPAISSADDVPAWLREAEPAPPPAAPAAGPSDDVPAWLREAEPAPPPPAGSSDIPTWLSSAEPQASPGTGGSDVPDWLREAEPPPATEAPVSDSDIPTWLREAEQAPPVPTSGDDVPAWLRDAPEPTGRRAAAPIESKPEAATPQSEQGDLPDWLSAGASDTTASSGTGNVGDMSLPSWLRGVADEEPPARPAPRTGKADDTTTSRRRGSVSEDAEGDDFLKGTELPGWLRPVEPEQPVVSAEGQALGWLTRLGTPDESEIESSPSGTREALQVSTPARRVYQPTSEQLEAISLLRRLVRTPYPTPVDTPAPAPLPRWQRIGLDRVLYVLLAVVLLVGLIVPQITGPFQTVKPIAPGTSALNEQLARLGPEDVVLVAYEWDAQRSAELRPLEQAVTDQLIQHKTKLILLSTDLQGTLLSFDMRSKLRAAGYNIDPDNKVFGGRDYVLLGYRPGGELALRRLAQDLRAELASDFEGRDATKGLLATNFDGSPRVSTIRDLSMIIVLGDQAQDVQVWMEQVHTAAPGVPITFLMPQEAEPLVQPYLHLPNVYHLAGLQGALALRALDQNADRTAIAQSTGQQSLAVVAFVTLLIGSSIGVAIARARRSRRGAA